MYKQAKYKLTVANCHIRMSGAAFTKQLFCLLVFYCIFICFYSNSLTRLAVKWVKRAIYIAFQCLLHTKKRLTASENSMKTFLKKNQPFVELWQSIYRRYRSKRRNVLTKSCMLDMIASRILTQKSSIHKFLCVSWMFGLRAVLCEYIFWKSSTVILIVPKWWFQCHLKIHTCGVRTHIHNCKIMSTNH